jgi:hypothetical protein
MGQYTAGPGEKTALVASLELARRPTARDCFSVELDLRLATEELLHGDVPVPERRKSRSLSIGRRVSWKIEVLDARGMGLTTPAPPEMAGETQD